MKISSIKHNSNQSFGMSMKVSKNLLKQGASNHLKQLNEALDLAGVQVAIKKHKFKASAPIDAGNNYKRVLKIEASPLEKDKRNVLTKIIDVFKEKRACEKISYTFNEYGKTNPNSHEISHVINQISDAVLNAVEYNSTKSVKEREELFNSTLSKIRKLK